MLGGLTRPMLPHDDGKSNENCKRALGLKQQNNNFARASDFLVHFVAIVARLRRETSWFHALEDVNTREIFFFFFGELTCK